MKIFIGGARTQKDIDTAVKKRILNIVDGGYTILVGDCYGIDASVQSFLKSMNYSNVCVYASNGKARNNLGKWEIKSINVPPSAKGFDFYVQKDKAMAKDADFGLMVWDGKSKGTLNNMINLLLQEKSVLLYLVGKHKMITLKTMDDLEKIVISLGTTTTKLFYSLLPKDNVLNNAVGNILFAPTEQIRMPI